MWMLFEEKEIDETKSPTRIFVDVTCDLFHYGHVNFFKKVKEYLPNVYLIVGVHPDSDCEAYKRKPIMNHAERCESVRNCKYVDEVVENSPIGVTEQFIKDHQIDLVIHGDDIDTDSLEQYSVPIELGIMRYVSYTPGISTSEIIQRVISQKF